MNDTRPDAMTLRREMIELIGGSWTTQITGTAARLKIAQHLAAGAATAEEVAAAAGSAPGATRRLLRAMCSLGLARQVDATRFESTPKGDLLRSDVAGSFYGMSLSWTERLWNAWGGLEAGIRTGEPQVLSGADGFASMAERPDEAAVLNQSQADRSRGAAAEVARVYDFSRFGEVMDVGGGYGTVLAAILRACPAVRGNVFDLAYLEEKSLAFQAGEGVGERSGFVGGSFFDGVPSGPDCYILKSILHDWDDDQCRTILRNIVAASKPGGTVIVIEQVLPEIAEDDPVHHSAFRTDLTMLLGTGGLERTEAEFRALMKACGLTLRRLLPNESEFMVLEATVD
ncbi:MAG: tcmN [Sphingomonas bacterium]|nr:tcmN [Sphingomonas bacterium]